jgi:hypothetical protein
MPTTTKMGIVYPASTDLVKDGATAMGTISTTVDAKTGLVYLSTTTFTGVASVSLPAATFTSNYTNYKLILNVTSDSVDLPIELRFRTSGTDNTTNNYFMRGIESIFGSNPNLANDGTYSTLFSINAGTNAMLIADIISPQATARTAFIASGTGVRADGNNAAWFVNTWFNATTSFDSMTFLGGGNNFSGSIFIYGYNK